MYIIFVRNDWLLSSRHHPRLLRSRRRTDGRTASDTLELSRVDKSTCHTSRNAISGGGGGEEVDVSGPGSSGDPGAVAGMLRAAGRGRGRWSSSAATLGQRPRTSTGRHGHLAAWTPSSVIHCC